MSEKRHRSSSHRSRSERMRESLDRTSFRGTEDSAGWPTPERAPRTARADSCGPSQGAIPCHEGSSQPPVAIPDINQGLSTEVHVASAGPVAAQDQATTSTGQQSGPRVGERDGEADNSLVHGAGYGGFVPTRTNSSLVADEEAAARLEWCFQKLQRQSSRTHSHGDMGGSPKCSGAQGQPPRTFLDDRPGESHSATIYNNMQTLMERMGQQLAASTSAMASMKAAHDLSSGSGEYIFSIL
jgi:hypothetical protein